MSDTNKNLAYINLPEGEARWAYLDNPRPPIKGNGPANYSLTVAYTETEANALLELIEPYMQQIDAMYPNTPRDQMFGMKPETKSKNDRTPTGRYLLEIRNAFPVKVYDSGNNLIEPAPRIGAGSRVIMNIGILPYEFNGKHGISRTRLYNVKVTESKEGGAPNPFGEASGVPTMQAGVVAPQVGVQQTGAAPRIGAGAPAVRAPQANAFMPAQGAPQVGAQQAPAAPGLQMPFDDDVPF